jgi:hypothetical protein
VASVPEPESWAMMVFGMEAVGAAMRGKAIGERTRAALQAAKARGTRLGNPNGAEAFRWAEKENGTAVGALKVDADRFAGGGGTRPVVSAEPACPPPRPLTRFPAFPLSHATLLFSFRAQTGHDDKTRGDG